MVEIFVNNLVNQMEKEALLNAELLEYYIYMLVVISEKYLLGNDAENVIPRSGSNYTSTVIDGATASGSVTTNSSSAIANTVYTNPGGNRTAVAYVYYEDCDLYYRSSATSSSTQSGGVQATATRTIIGAEVVGGQGIHSLAYKTYTWNDYTSTGLIPAVIVN